MKLGKCIEHIKWLIQLKEELLGIGIWWKSFGIEVSSIILDAIRKKLW